MVGLLLNAFSRGPKDFAAGVELRAKENATRRFDERDQLALEQTRREEAAKAAEAQAALEEAVKPAPGLALPMTGEDGRMVQWVTPTTEAPPAPAPAPAAPKQVAGVAKKAAPLPGYNPNAPILLRNNLAASPEDIGYLVRTVWGEARGSGTAGMVDVANVIINRAIRSGQSIKQVVLSKSQFEPWGNAKTRREMQTMPTATYRQIENAIRGALRPDSADTTGGATLFYAPAAQAALGRKAPAWAIGDNMTMRRGGHNFYKGGFRGDQGRRAGVGVPKTPPSADEVSSQTAFVEQAADPATSPQVFKRWDRVFMADPTRPSREIETALMKRQDYVNQMKFAAAARDVVRARALRLEIQSIDNNMIMLKGVQATNLAREGSPEMALQVLSAMNGATYQLAPRSDNSVTVLKNGQPINGMKDMSYDKFLDFLANTFIAGHAAAAAEFAALKAKNDMESNRERALAADNNRSEERRAELTARTQVATNQTTADAQLANTNLRGGYDVAVENLRQNSAKDIAMATEMLKIDKNKFELKAGADGQMYKMEIGTGKLVALVQATKRGPNGDVTMYSEVPISNAYGGAGVALPPGAATPAGLSTNWGPQAASVNRPKTAQEQAYEAYWAKIRAQEARAKAASGSPVLNSSYSGSAVPLPSPTNPAYR